MPRERQSGSRQSTVGNLRQQGGATTTVAGASSRDPRSTLGAYQYGVRTGRGSATYNVAGVPSEGAAPIRARGGARRGSGFDQTNQNLDFFNDALMQRMGGDESVAGRIVDLQRWNWTDPTRGVDFYNQWSEDPYTRVFDPLGYEYGRSMGEQYRQGKPWHQMADWLFNWTGTMDPADMYNPTAGDQSRALGLEASGGFM